MWCKYRFFSLFAAHIARDAKIYAFEPADEAFRLMKSLLKENGIKNIFPVNIALGDTTKPMVMLKVSGGLGLSNVLLKSSYRPPIANYDTTQTVWMETIDNVVFNILGLKKVDLIKIDTEGFERQILAGALKTVKKFKPAITCAGYHLPEDEKIISEFVLKLNRNTGSKK